MELLCPLPGLLSIIAKRHLHFSLFTFHFHELFPFDWLLIMKFIVFSDSHGVSANMIRAVQAEKPDLCFYLGDGENDLRLLQKRFPRLAVNAVRGNCDMFSSSPKIQVMKRSSGFRYFSTHRAYSTEARLMMIRLSSSTAL